MERKESLLKLFQDLGCKVESDAVLDKCELSFDLINSKDIESFFHDLISFWCSDEIQNLLKIKAQFWIIMLND